MSITYAGRKNSAFSTGTVATLPCTLANAVTGNQIIVCVVGTVLGGAAPTITVSDSNGLTFTQIATSTYVWNTTNNVRMSIFGATCGSGGVGYSVTPAFGTNAYANVCVSEFSGVAIAAADVSAAIGQTTATTFTTTTGATAQAAELCIGLAYVTSGSWTSLSTTYGTLLSRATWSGNIDLADQYKILSATGTQAVDWTFTPSMTGAAFCATIRASGGTAQVLAGACVGLGSATGLVVCKRTLTGTPAGLGTATGLLVSKRTLAGSAVGAGSATGALTLVVPGALSGACAGLGAATGLMVCKRTLKGAPAGLGTMAGGFTGLGPITTLYIGDGGLQVFSVGSAVGSVFCDHTGTLASWSQTRRISA